MSLYEIGWLVCSLASVAFYVFLAIGFGHAILGLLGQMF